MTLFIWLGDLYLILLVSGIAFWTVSIYKTARLRQFAADQLKGQLKSLTSDYADKKRRLETVRFLLGEIRSLDRVMVGVQTSPDMNKVGIDLVSVYILRAKLGIQTEEFARLLAKSSSKIIARYITRLDDIKRQVEIEASGFSAMDRQFIVKRFVANIFELNDLVEPNVSIQPRIEQNLIDEGTDN
jgi:hypothetical protein